METIKGDAGARGHPQSGSLTHLGSGWQENGLHGRGSEKLREVERARCEMSLTLFQFDLIQIRSHSQLLGTGLELTFSGGHNSNDNTFPT